MSTGNRLGAAAPNNSTQTSTDYSRPGIAQLNQYANGNGTRDGVQLQFDFVTLSNTVNFRYSFASEEYPEYAGSSFNDVFAFFISGPGITGWQNIAIVPGSNPPLPVAINSINASTNAQYYLSNGANGNVEYDGMTRRLTATATVQPCQTYTLRICIADVFDGIYDSAVFLEQNSFNGGIVNITASGATATDTSATEACDQARFNFTLANPLAQPYTINYTLAGTAQNGVDYQTLPTSITIPAGQTTAQLIVNGIFDGIPEGVETVDLIYQAPCGPVTTRVFIKNVDPITINAGADINMCAGTGPVSLSATATGGGPSAYTYTWNNGAGNGQSANVNPSITTTYTCTVTNTCPNVPAATDQVVVNVNPIPTASFTTNAPVCPGSPIVTQYNGTAGPNATYNWLATGGTITGSGQSVQITYPSSGSYTIGLTVIENGCSSPSSTVPVTVYTQPSSAFTVAPGQVCTGSPVTVTYTPTPLAGATYNWNFGGGTVISGTGAGPYQVSWPSGGQKTISLAVTWNGCVSTTTQQIVDVFDIPTADFITGAAICEGSSIVINYSGSADINDPNAVFNWNWGGGTIATNPFGQNYTVTYPTAGTPTVTLTVIENGCQSQPYNQQITVNAVPTATFTYPSQLCLNAGGAFQFNGINAGANATYNWNFNGGTVNSGTGGGPLDVSWASTGNKQVTLSVTTNNGCQSSPVTVTIPVRGIPTSDFTATTNLCQGQSSTITFQGTAGSNANYQWNFDGGSVANGATGAGPYQINWGLSGSFDVELTVSDSGCTSTLTTQNVVIGSIPGADAGLDVTICSGGLVQIGNAPLPGAVYEWINNLTDIADPTQSQQQFTVVNSNTPVAPIVRTYTLQVSLNGCVGTDDVIVTVNPQPIATFTAPSPQCLTGNSYTFTAGGSFSNAATFNWLFANANPATSSAQNPSSIVFSSTGTQSVTFNIDDYGCTASYTADIEVLSEPNVDFTATPINGCAPVNVQFTNLSGYGNNATYVWDFGDLTSVSTSSDPNHLYTDAGTYDVSLQVSLGQGCRKTLTKPAYIDIYRVPAASFVVSPNDLDILSPVATITNTSVGAGLTCMYDIDSDIVYDCDFEYTFPDTGSYNIIQYVENIHGCKDTAEQRVIVRPATTLYIPSAFTPDGDGLNDTFRAQGLSIYNYAMHIYNRWGERIFVTNSLYEGWDGSFKGKDCPVDVYLYHIKYSDVKGGEYEERGHLSLIK